MTPLTSTISKPTNLLKLPFQTILLSWSAFFLCVLFPWIAADYSYVTPWYLIFFIFCFFFFYAFFFFGTQVTIKPWLKTNIFNFYTATILLLLLTVACRAFDRFYLRGVEDFFSVASVRASREGDSNLFSVLAAILTPFALVGWRVATEHTYKRRLRFVAMGLIAFIVLDVLVSGSRGTLLIILTLLMGRSLTAKRLILIIPSAVVLSTAFFLWRFNSLQGYDDTRVLLHSLASDGYSKFVGASDWYTTLLNEGNWLSIFLFSFLQAAQYLTHGFFEFAYLFNTGPQFQFDPSILLPHLRKVFDFTLYLERKNLYYTLFGTLFIGFGYFSIIIGSLLGYFLGLLYRNASTTSVSCRNVILLSIFLTPFVNSFGGYDFYLYFLAIYFFSSLSIHKRSTLRNGEIHTAHNSPDQPGIAFAN